MKQSLTACRYGLCCLKNKYDNSYLELVMLEIDLNERGFISLPYWILVS
jgi:hypothetical protein